MVDDSYQIRAIKQLAKIIPGYGVRAWPSSLAASEKRTYFQAHRCGLIQAFWKDVIWTLVSCTQWARTQAVPRLFGHWLYIRGVLN